MKFARLLLFFLLALSLRPALAQVATKPANATPIRYSRNIPKSVLKLMPRGAKSLFWGTFSPKKGSAAMAIHLFVLRPKTDFAALRYGGTLHFALDIFVQDSATWNHLNHVPITFTSINGMPDRVSAKLFWLDKEQTQPLLNLESFTKNGYWQGEPIGDALFLSFTQRWDVASAPQKLYFGGSNSGLTTYQVQRTGDGTLQIRRDIGSRSSESSEITFFRSNGKKFIVTPQTRQTVAPDEKEWLP